MRTQFVWYSLVEHIQRVINRLIDPPMLRCAESFVLARGVKVIAYRCVVQPVELNRTVDPLRKKVDWIEIRFVGKSIRLGRITLVRFRSVKVVVNGTFVCPRVVAAERRQYSNE